MTPSPRAREILLRHGRPEETSAWPPSAPGRASLPGPPLGRGAAAPGVACVIIVVVVLPAPLGAPVSSPRAAHSPARPSLPRMPVLPIPRRVRSFHGPHTTCLHSACGPVRQAPLGGPPRTKYHNFDLYLKSRWMYGFIRFLLYFSCSLFTSLLWVALSLSFGLQYLAVRAFLRFQYKLSVALLLLGRRRLDFGLLNELLIYGIHVTMLLVGGLGWCFMVFVDM